MLHRFHTDLFQFEYKESQIDDSVLWESHCHPRFELIGVLEGDVNVMLEGTSHRLTEGQVIMVPSLYYHTITANQRMNNRRVIVLFDPVAIPEVLMDTLVSHPIPTVFFSPHIESLRAICQSEHHTLYIPLAEALMTEIFYDALKKTTEQTLLATDEFLEKTLSYIDRHLCERILLCDLARLTSRSKSSFCHLFEEKMKISPKQYILQKKLAYADKLIGEGVPRTEAALRIGYENYSNFYRLYKKNLPTKNDH